jgi:hypothetical protein
MLEHSLDDETQSVANIDSTLADQPLTTFSQPTKDVTH